MRAPVEAPLKHGEPSTRITTPAWLQWFQQSFDRAVTGFNGRFGAVTPETGDYTASQVTGAVPDTRTVNGHALTADVTVTLADVDGEVAGAVAAHEAAFDHGILGTVPDFTALPVHADNAAALVGGLVAGAVYRTATGVLMVVY